MKYTEDATFGELFELPEVQETAKIIMPDLMSGKAAEFLTGIPLRQLIAARPEAAPLAEILLAAANGEHPDLSALDARKQKPVLTDGPFGHFYDPGDPDGKMYMLNRRFSGTCCFGTTKQLDTTVRGRVTFQGREVPYCIETVAEASGKQFLGVYVSDICREFGRSYTFHAEGFRDTDGNTMDPQDLIVETRGKRDLDPAYREHDENALTAAEEGMVLLKNVNHLLPLPAGQRIVLVMDVFRDGAVGAGKINPRYRIGLEEALGKAGFPLEVKTFTEFVKEQESPEGQAAGKNSGKSEDVCILVISRASGENHDNGPFPGEYYLTETEKQAIAIAEKNDSKVIALINSGYPMDVRWTGDDAVGAALWTGFGGMFAGQAVAEILSGTVNPSGKLSDTWALDYYDIPASRNFYTPEDPDHVLGADDNIWINTVYEEDIYVGYRYFDTFQKNVAYPFGYGLSYTDFEWICSFEPENGFAERNDRAEQLKKGGSAGTMIVSVQNTGDTAGKDVVEIYAGIPEGKLEQPDKRLVGFAKTKLLAPGEREELRIPICLEDLASYDETRHAYLMEAGTYTFLAGKSVEDTKSISSGSFTLKEEQILEIVGDYMKPPVEFTRLSKKDPEGTFPKGTLSGIVLETNALPNQEKRQHIDTPSEPFDGIDLSDWSNEELARLSVCANAGWGMQDTGVAGRIFRLEGRDIPKYEVSDGNNGVNINKPNIGMPTSNLVAATWNREIAELVGRTIGEEARENDIRMILAPAMNIHRNPLCGRQPEYFSEDPLLSGIMAGYHLKGLEESGTDGCIKHVCCNNAESSRKRNHSIVSQRALREIYLRNFAIAFRVHEPAGIMTGYNACNGVFTAEDEELIQGVFRRELGFRGIVMTDWNSYDTADVARAAEAGNDWFTPGTSDDTYTSKIRKGLQDGVLTRERLEDNVRHILYVLRRS